VGVAFNGFGGFCVEINVFKKLVTMIGDPKGV
jgi:hypothetical protein